MPNRIQRLGASLAGVGALALLLGSTPATTSSRAAKPVRAAPLAHPAAATRCTNYAAAVVRKPRRHAPAGSRSNPFRTLTRLDSSLAPGQTGCLLAGRYGSINAFHRLFRSGTPSQRITITADPGARVTVVGWIAMDGSYMTLSGLNIDGSNTFAHSPQDQTCGSTASQGLAISGADDVLENNNIYQSVRSLRGNGIGIGWDGQPNGTIVRYNRIHDVGQCQDFDHIIYLSHGDNVRIYDNWLWNDAHGWGVQLYPAPRGARIYDNVIDGAGSGLVFADEGDGHTSGNLAYNNVVVNSVGISGTSSGSYAGVLVNSPGVNGTGNRVFQNDSFRNRGGVANIDHTVSSASLLVNGNLSLNPRFVDARAHDYRLRASSPLRWWGLWGGRHGG